MRLLAFSRLCVPHRERAMLLPLLIQTTPFIGLHANHRDGYAWLLEEKLANWDALVLRMPIPGLLNTINTDYFEFDLLRKLAATKGKKAIIRLPAEVPTTTYWKDLAGGQDWQAIYLPPRGPNNRLWNRQGEWNQAIVNASRRVCKSLNISTQSITFELANEKNIGGANGPMKMYWSIAGPIYNRHLALQKDCDSGKTEACEPAKTEFLRVFPTWCLDLAGKPLPEGTIPERTWEHLLYLRGRVAYGGFGLIGYTAESAGGKVGDTELASIKGVNAGLYFRASYVWGKAINHYTQQAYSLDKSTTPYRVIHNWKDWLKVRSEWTPQEIADKYYRDGVAKLDRINKHPLLGQIPNTYITEFGARKTDVYDQSKIAELRTLVIGKVRQLPINGGGMFTALDTDGLTYGYNLWEITSQQVLSPIGGEVYP